MKKLGLFAILSMGLISSGAWASSEENAAGGAIPLTGPYVGINAGVYHLNKTLKDLKGSSSDVKFSKNRGVAGLEIGYAMTPYFSVGVVGNYYMQYKCNYVRGSDTFTTEVKGHYKTAGARANFRIPLGEVVQMTLVGGAEYVMPSKVNATLNPYLTQESSVIRPVVGIGLGIAPSSSPMVFKLTLEDVMKGKGFKTNKTDGLRNNLISLRLGAEYYFA